MVKFIKTDFGPYKNKKFLVSLAISFGMLLVGLYVNAMASIYATSIASNPVTDLILSNIRLYDVDALFIYGPILLWIFIITICLLHPKKMPFTFKALSLFLIIRAAFVSLTHIGPFPTQQIVSTKSIMTLIGSGNDFFFSAHTGLPFLMALVFWQTPLIRNICLIASVFFGTIVLLGHYHYSIDVFAAFFMTFSIFSLAKYFFKKDYREFRPKEVI